MTKSPLLFCAVSAFAALTLTACTSGGGNPASTSPPSATTTQTQTQTQTRTETATSRPETRSPVSTSDDGGSTPSACKESQLRASIDSRRIPGNGTKGDDGKLRHGVVVDFVNKSASTCTLTGYPGAAIEDSSNKQVQQAKRSTHAVFSGAPTKVSTVTLKPTTTAVALLDGVDTREQGAAQAGCDETRYPRILVTPPNTDTPVPFTVGWPQCYSFRVHPVQLRSA